MWRVSWGEVADEYHSNSKLAQDPKHTCRPLHPADYHQRSSMDAEWPKDKILLSVTVELLRHYLVKSPDICETEDHDAAETEDQDGSETEDHVVSETEEIEWICALLRNRRFKPSDCTEDAVRYHFENFNFPALTHIISTLSTYETKDAQEPTTYQPEHPIYDAFDISIQAIMSGQLFDKEVLDQPFNMSGLITTLRRIVGTARVQHFTTLYGRCPNLEEKLKEGAPTWEGYEEAVAFDDFVFEAICTLVQNDIYEM